MIFASATVLRIRCELTEQHEDMGVSNPTNNNNKKVYKQNTKAVCLKQHPLPTTVIHNNETCVFANCTTSVVRKSTCDLGQTGDAHPGSKVSEVSTGGKFVGQDKTRERR